MRSAANKQKGEFAWLAARYGTYRTCSGVKTIDLRKERASKSKSQKWKWWKKSESDGGARDEDNNVVATNQDIATGGTPTTADNKLLYVLYTQSGFIPGLHLSMVKMGNPGETLL